MVGGARDRLRRPRFLHDGEQPGKRFSPGSFTFNGTGTTGNSMGDFLTGQLDTFSQGEPNVGFTRQWYIGAYVADTWKLSSRLTVSAGLRWEPNLARCGGKDI